MCYLIQKHVFIHFLNNQKLLILFNKIDVIVGKSLVKPWLSIIYSLVLLIIVLKNVEKFFIFKSSNQNFRQDRKVELLCKSIAPLLQKKFRFMGCLVKANVQVSGNR